MRFCPRCGAPVEPNLKFCTSCGGSLTPDIPKAGTAESPQGLPSAQAAPSAARSYTGFIAVAGVIILIIGILFVGYPFLTGSSVLSAAGLVKTPTPTPVPTEQAGGSWVEVVTIEPTSIPTTEPTPVTSIPTTLITTSQTTVTPTKPVVCPSDKIKCDNKCVDSRTDAKNCGYCGTACTSNQMCLNGVCRAKCTSSQTSCPGGCYDLQNDPDHCGTCNNNCPAGLLCVEGGCRSPLTPMPNPI